MPRPVEGVWQYFDGGSWKVADRLAVHHGLRSLDAGTLLRFLPAADYADEPWR